ncbi:MAG: hypothetical protein KTU85_12525 [Acidimicrobiia bacterium]|nr:hypothetical protein [Acidimicrobiia bacterium]
MVITKRTLHQPPNTRNPKTKKVSHPTTAPQQPTAANTPNTLPNTQPEQARTTGHDPVTASTPPKRRTVG